MAKQDKQSTLQVTDNNAGSIPQSVATPSIPADAVSVPVANGTIDTAPLDNFKTINVDNNRTILPEIGTSGAITSPAENNAAETVPQNSNPTQPYTVLNDTQACTPLEGPNYPIHNENQNTTPSPQNKNGYIHSSLTRTSYPSHSISCYENLSSLSSNTSFEEKYVKNGFRKDDRCKTRTTGTTQIRPFLKTSTSFHTGLGETFQKRSSLRNNISLSYFTSTFNIFMNKTNT